MDTAVSKDTGCIAFGAIGGRAHKEKKAAGYAAFWNYFPIRGVPNSCENYFAGVVAPAGLLAEPAGRAGLDPAAGAATPD